MKNGKTRWLLLLALGLFLIVLNIAVFLFPFRLEQSFWVGYGFLTASVLLFAGMTFMSFKGRAMKEKFHGFPLFYMAARYLPLLQIVYFLFMLFPGIPLWISLSVSVAVLCVYGIGLIFAAVGREQVNRVENRALGKVSFLRGMEISITALSERQKAPEAREALRALAEALRFSDPISGDQLADIEARLSASCETLCGLADENQPADAVIAECARMKNLLSQRNALCRAMKTRP